MTRCTLAPPAGSCMRALSGAWGGLLVCVDSDNAGGANTAGFRWVPENLCWSASVWLFLKAY